MPVFNTPKFQKPGFRLALVASLLAIIVVLLGTFTRLVDAGLGCPDWPGCYGKILWVNGADEISQAEALYPESPVEVDKAWLEMAHRFLAGALGLIIVSLAVMSWRQRDNENMPFRLPTFILFLVAWQVLFGMWTVTLRLWPQVVTAHMLAGIATFSLLWLLTLRLDDQRWKMPAEVMGRLTQIKPWIVGAIVIIGIQILLGGWTSSNYAAFACLDFPTCQSQWWPEMDLKNGFNLLQSTGPNYLGGVLESDARVAIHVIHRVGALVTSIYLLILCGFLLSIRDRRTRRMALIIFTVLFMQLAFAVGNIALMAPLITAMTHTTGSVVLLLTLVTLATKVWTAKQEYKRSES
jgi:heme a synthase